MKQSTFFLTFSPLHLLLDLGATNLIWISHHISHINESCLTYQWVMSHISMSHVSHINESCLTYQWVMSHIWISHVSHINESCLTYQWVKPDVWRSPLSVFLFVVRPFLRFYSFFSTSLLLLLLDLSVTTLGGGRLSNSRRGVRKERDTLSILDFVLRHQFANFCARLE